MKAEERAKAIVGYLNMATRKVSHDEIEAAITQAIREAEQQTRNEALNALTRDALGCIDTERGVVCDNLAIVLASHFEHHMDRPEDDEDNPETGWGDWVIQKTDESLDHITSKIRALIEREGT